MIPADEGPYTFPIPEGPPQRPGLEIIIGPTELEHRANIDSLDLLQHQRRVLVAKLIARPDGRHSLQYLYGSGGDRATAVRRQHRDGIKRLLMEDPKQPEKADGKLDTLANSDPRHTAFCELLEQQFVEWYQLTNDLQDITERIDSRITELQSYNREIGLAK